MILRNRQRGATLAGVVAVTALAALVGAGVWLATGGSKAAPTPAAAVPTVVEVATVEQRDVPHYTRGIGAVQSLHQVTLRPQVEGILTEVLFTEGRMVHRGELLARIDDRAIAAALAQARAEMARNEAQLASARIDFERYDNLLRREAIAKQTVDQQTALVAQLEAAIAANRAAIAAAQVQLSYTRIVSPVTGRVGLRRVDPGNFVRPDDPQGLVTVTQIDPIAVVFSLPQALLPRLREMVGQAETAIVTAYAEADGPPLADGRLALLDNQIDPATGTIRLKAEFDNADGRLWPGQLVSVRLRTGVSRNALVVDRAAIVRGLDGAFVYRLTGDTVEAAPVTLAYEDADVAVIDAGLAAGDTVVTDGQSRLRPGSTVRVLAADAEAAAAVGAGDAHAL
jgi:RND family efflux transporter MFP subunit